MGQNKPVDTLCQHLGHAVLGPLRLPAVGEAARHATQHDDLAVPHAGAASRLPSSASFSQTAAMPRSSRPLIDGRPIQVHKNVIRSAQRAYLIRNGYWIEGEFIDNAYRAKYLLARSRLCRAGQGFAAIAAATNFTVDRSQAGFLETSLLTSACLRTHMTNLSSLAGL